MDFYAKTLVLLGHRACGSLYQKLRVLWASNMPKMRWQPAGLRPGPRWGLRELTSLPRPPSRLGTPPPQSLPLGALGTSILAPSALSFCAMAPNVKCWLRLWWLFEVSLHYAFIVMLFMLCYFRTKSDM